MARPRKDKPRSNFMNIRITDYERDMLQNLSERMEMSVSDVVRQALRVYFRLSKTEIEDEFSCSNN